MIQKLLTAAAFSILIAGCASNTANPYGVAGFTVIENDGRLFVFKENSPALEAFQKTGELSKQATNIGGGPNGMTVKAPDAQTLDSYLMYRRYMEANKL